MRRISLLLVGIVISHVLLQAPVQAYAEQGEKAETASSILLTNSTSATSVLPSVMPTVRDPIVLPVGDVIITGYRLDGHQLAYVELYNKSSDIVDLRNWQLTVRIMQDGSLVDVPQQLTGYALPKRHIVLAHDNTTTERDAELRLPLDLPVPTQLVLRVPGKYETSTKSMIFADGTAYALRQTSTGYTTTNEFLTGAAGLQFGGMYTPPEAAPLQVREVFANTRACGPGEDAVDCREYVKLCNTSTAVVALDLYRLRLGAANVGASVTNTVMLSGGLAVGGCIAIDARSDGMPLDVPSSGHVWIEDGYGLTQYLATDIQYDDINEPGHDGQAWAHDRIDGRWKWAVPTPASATTNFAVQTTVITTSDLAPCRADQYRSIETGRCRTIATASTPTPCREGQYRSEETGRCRSIAAAASVAKICAEDQFRNPETGRCKQIASTDDIAACPEGKERNPDTNRCRNISVSTMPVADFAVKPTLPGTEQFAAWWALGGLGLVALSYGIWEWRHEIGAASARLRGHFRSRAK